MMEYKLAEGELEPVGKAVLTLFTARDPEAFARQFTVKSNDWASLIATNTRPSNVQKLTRYAEGSPDLNSGLMADAQKILARAEALHLKFSGDELRARVIPGEVLPIATLGYNNEQGVLPYVERAEVILYKGEAASAMTSNSITITLRGLIKYPNGWRIDRSFMGIQWTGFPAGIVDAKTVCELKLQGKIADGEPVTSKEEPALLRLATTLSRFLCEANTNIFAKEILVSSDEFRRIRQEKGQPDPSHRESDEEMAYRRRELATANAVLELMRRAGVDFSKAEVRVQEASMERCRPKDLNDLQGTLSGSPFKVVLRVKTDAKSASGASLSGDYVLGAEEILRLDGVWKVGRHLYWEDLPEGVIDSETRAAIRLERYVSKFQSLPAGGTAPEIEFTVLTGERKMKLSDFKGKVVVLDFWCGPTLEQVAELQKIKTAHPDWGENVVVIPVSIEDSMQVARDHVERRAFTNTFNVWAGAGGWQSTTAKAFRVTSVPICYVLDREGVIRWSGEPIENTVDIQVEQVLEK